MYQVGDLIIYGAMGVCSVIDITDAPEDVNQQQPYYVLKPLYHNCEISTPVDNPRVFARPVITKEEAERLIDMIPRVQPQPCYDLSTQQLAEHYKSRMATHDCAELIKVTMSMHAKKQLFEQQKRKFGLVEGRFMKQAEDMLFGELAVALGIAKDEVQAYITSRVSGEPADQE